MGDYRRRLLGQTSWGVIFAKRDMLDALQWRDGPAAAIPGRIQRDPKLSKLARAKVHQAQLEDLSRGMNVVIPRLKMGAFRRAPQP